MWYRTHKWGVASGFNTTPDLTGYFAHKLLYDNNQIEHNAVIINGQTGDFISGGHIPILNGNDRNNIVYTDLMNKFISKHYSLWTNLINDNNKNLIYDIFSTLYKYDKDKRLSYQQFSDYLWNYRIFPYILGNNSYFPLYSGIFPI